MVPVEMSVGGFAEINGGQACRYRRAEIIFPLDPGLRGIYDAIDSVQPILRGALAPA